MTSDLFLRVAVWILHSIVTVLMLSAWVFAGPGMLIAWLMEKLAEQVEKLELVLTWKQKKPLTR